MEIVGRHAQQWVWIALVQEWPKTTTLLRDGISAKTSMVGLKNDGNVGVLQRVIHLSDLPFFIYHSNVATVDLTILCSRKYS
jgi:hypothetical protein